MRSKAWLLLAAFALLAAVSVAAQAPQTLVIEFVDGVNLDVIYPDATSYSYRTGSVMEGDSVPVGAVVKTGAGTSVELKLKPNGTVIKLAKMSTFKVEGLATPQKEQNGFTLVSGKLRTVAAKGGQYAVYTSTTVAGVRGTDFSMAFEEGAKAMLLVAEGAVEFGGRAADGGIADAIMVGAGQFADFFQGLVAAPFSPEQLAEAYDGLDIPPERLPAAPAEEAITEEPAKTAEPSGPATATAADFSPAEAPAADQDSARAAGDQVGNAVIDWLRDALGMEIGSITINGETWAKAVIQPTFAIGKLKMGLYLPVIYSSNLFDPSTWYRPAGNDEWSFGFDKGWNAESWPAALLDAATDLALKIRFVEYGQPLVDPFFLKVGNLKSFTVGHGLLMRNYANDSDFPSIRRVGVNLGVDAGGWGFEALTNDLTSNEIVGGRLFVRPVPDFKLALGLSGIVDLYPGRAVNEAVQPDRFGDPLFIGGALDLDLPIVTSALFGLRLYADGAAMIPYVRNDFTYRGTNGGATGFRLDMVWDGQSVRNWGAAGGLMGNVFFIDWRLEYRYFTGAFRPAFFDSGYERRRASLVEEWAGYLSGATTADQSPSMMGVYGEGGATILNDKLSLTLGYFWPWAPGATVADQLSASDDYFKAALSVKKGLIPVVDLAGAISYERRGLVKAIAEGQTVLFDENTVFSGELSVPIPGAPNLDLAVIVSTAVARDQGGAIQFQEGTTKPLIVPAITLETRLHF